MSMIAALGWTVIITALLVLAGSCFALAWWLGRRTLARALDTAQLPPLDPDVIILPPRLPVFGPFPVEGRALTAIRWSEVRAHQDSMARDVAAQAAATAAEIRALTAEAEQRIPERWRHAPSPRGSGAPGSATPATRLDEGTRQPRPLPRRRR